MYNHIVFETPGEIRAMARERLKGSWLKMAAAVMLFFVFTATIPLILDSLTSFTRIVSIGERETEITMSIGSTLYTLIMTGAFELGIVMLLLNLLRTGRIDSHMTMGGFQYFVKSMLLFLLMGVIVLVCTAAFVVPGIIAALRYSQAFYILADHPEYSPKQCLKESARLMDGNKERYFALTLSFIGWLFLAVIPQAAINGLVSGGVFNIQSQILIILMSLVLMVPMYFVIGYMDTAQAVFYGLLTGEIQGMDEEYEGNIYDGL